MSQQNTSGLASNIIQLTLGQAFKRNEAEQDSIRIDTQEWLYDYYKFSKSDIILYLEDCLIKVLGKDVVDNKEWIYSYINITKKIIDSLAVVYKEPAHRYTDDEKINEYLDLILPPSINSIDKEAHRIAKLQNTSLTQIFFDKRKGKLGMNVEGSHKYKVKVDDDDNLELIKYRKYFTNSKGEKELFDVVWTQDEHYKEDQLGNKYAVGNNEERINPFKDGNGAGVIPFAKLMLTKGEDYWGVGQCDLVNVNENINFLLTFLKNDSIILGSGGTTLITNCNLGKVADDNGGYERVRVGRRHPIQVDNVRTDMVAPRVEYISTQPLITEIQNAIDYEIKQIAILKGVNPNTIISQVKDTSDYQRMMDSVEQIEIRRDDIEPCREYESERWEIIKAVNNAAAKDSELKSKFKLMEIPFNLPLHVDFIETKAAVSMEARQKDWDWQLSKNLITIVNIAKELNPDLDEEELKTMIEENKQLNGSLTVQPTRLEALLNKQKVTQ